MTNEPICRIDRLKYSDMEKLNDLVIGVKGFVLSYLGLDCEDYIREVVERIEDLFDGKIGQFEYVAITQLLQKFARAANRNDEASNQHNVNVVTAEIIKIVQGDMKMDKNQLSAMVYRRVIEAMNKAEHGAVNGYEPGPMASDIAEDTAVRIVEDVFGGKVPLEAELVSKYYEMDPETEDVLHNGSLILDGMKVLIEDPSYRNDVGENMSVNDLTKARMRNRWCTVEASKIMGLPSTAANLTFIGVYDDGVKRKWDIAVTYAWIVKKDSIPRVDQVLDPGGNLAYTDTAAKILEFFRKTDESYHSRYSVLVGGTDIAMPADQYVLNNGEVRDPGHVLRKAAITDTEIFDEDGLSVLSGTVHDIQKWAMNLPSDSVYLEYRLRYAGYDKLTTVRNFLTQPVWDGQE